MSDAAPHTPPTPIGWSTLRRWIDDTREVDDRTYRAARRTSRPVPWWRAPCPDLRRPVFIVGAPRSGTTFLGGACAALPELSYHYEPPLIKAAARYVVEGRWSERRLRRLYRATYGWLLRRHGDAGLRFAEKTPQNCVTVDFLAHAFPGARFVHIVRDGRDAALSHRAEGWLSAASAVSGRRESGGYPLGPTARFWVEPERRREFETTSDLHRCIWAWRRHTQSALEKLAALPASAHLKLRYEKLVTSPASEGERLLDFLEIADAGSRSLAQAHMAKANPDRIGGWRSALTPDERNVVEREAGSLLARLGYGWEASR